MKSQKGFTLIEMVIVIAVIGILMGLSFTGFQGVQANARDTRRIADLKKVQTFLELYYNKCGHYPGGVNCAAANNQNPGWETAGTGLKAVLESTVANSGDVPDDPISNRHYKYGVDTTVGELGFRYILGATMEKGAPATGIKVDTYGISCDQTNEFCLQ